MKTKAVADARPQGLLKRDDSPSDALASSISDRRPRTDRPPNPRSRVYSELFPSMPSRKR
jgi:hypothetical protein